MEARQGKKFSDICTLLAYEGGDENVTQRVAGFLSQWFADGLVTRLRDCSHRDVSTSCSRPSHGSWLNLVERVFVSSHDQLFVISASRRNRN